VGLNERLRKLERKERGRDELLSDEGATTHYEEFWEMQMEWTALHLIRGIEPDFTLDETDAFVTLDGRFAVSRQRIDLRGLMGPRTQAMQETIANTPERWGRFLAADEEADELLERLLGLGEDAAVPEDYRGPGHEWHDQAEIRERIGGPHGVGGSIFLDAGEREAARRLTWTLTHNPDARAMLSELTRRRDAFVMEEGSMPTELPPY
jgi:hypothetical protein